MSSARSARRLLTATAAAVTVGLALAGTATAAWDGERAPDDPLYDIAEEQPAGHTFHEEQWFLYSFIPRTAPLATDPEGAAGMSIDLAWRRYGTGRPDVRIAYIEGGVNWRHARRAARARAARVPQRGRAARGRPARRRHDANGDGQVNVADYAWRPARAPALPPR